MCVCPNIEKYEGRRSFFIKSKSMHPQKHNNDQCKFLLSFSQENNAECMQHYFKIQRE